MSKTTPDGLTADDYELLQGIGAVEDEGTDTHTVRIVPIGEGDVTVGQSENRTYWAREALRDAVERGAFDGAKIVKGQGGEGHFSLNEQVPPERLLGRVDEWDYEEGVGPVGQAELLDDDLAQQIDMDLLEVSADMIRHLGAYDNDADAYNVDEIVAVPRITVLDRGASRSADIELTSASVPISAPRVGAQGGPATEQLAGALGVEDDRLREYLQSAGDAVRWESSAGGEREPANYRYGVVVDDLQDGPEDSVLVAVYQPTADYDGWENRNEQNPIQEDTLEVVGSDGVASLPPVSQVTEQNAPADGAEGGGGGDADADGEGEDADGDDDVGGGEGDVGADEPTTPSDGDVSGNDGGQDSPDDTALEALLKRVTRYVRGIVPSTGDPTLDDALENLNEADGATTGWQPSDGAGYMPSEERNGTASVPGTDPRGGASTSDERAESRRDTSTYTTYNTMPNNDPSPQEQLADARATIRTLEADIEEKDERLEELNDKIEEKESEIEQLEGDLDDAREAEEDLESLREQIEPWQETLAGIAAGNSMLEADTIAETHSFEQLSNTVLAQLDDDDDDSTPMDRLREQLSDGVKTRGEAPEEPPTEPESEEDEARAEQLAESVMNLSDLRRANREELSSREYIRETHGVDPASVDSEAELRRKMAADSGGD